MTTNVATITKYCIEDGLILNNTKQTVNGFTLYPSEYFCPKDYNTKEINLTENSYTIHYFDGSWVTNYLKLREKISKFIGPKLTEVAINIKRKIKLNRG